MVEAEREALEVIVQGAAQISHDVGSHPSAQVVVAEGDEPLGEGDAEIGRTHQKKQRRLVAAYHVVDHDLKQPDLRGVQGRTGESGGQRHEQTAPVGKE